MRDNQLLQRIRDARPSVGSWLTIPDSFVAEVMGNAGMDFLVIDTEHSPMSSGQLHGVLLALTASASTILVRVPDRQEVHIKHALDLGAEGIIVPNVSSPGDCVAAFEAARYAPLGRRGFGPRRASRLHGDRADYLNRANEQVAVIPIVETAEAVENIADILAAAPIDAVMVGPADLAVSMGYIHDLQHQTVQDAAEKVRVACRDRGVPFGVFTGTEATARTWIERGALLTVLGADLQYIDAGIAKTRTERARVLEGLDAPSN